MSRIDDLEAAFAVILEEARSNDAFRTRLEVALEGGDPRPSRRRGRLGSPDTAASAPPKRRNRRDKAILDPFAVCASGGEPGLRAALAALDVEKLKDVIAEFDMDRDRLASKWRSPDRLIERIVETVMARNRKGDAFLHE